MINNMYWLVLMDITEPDEAMGRVPKKLCKTCSYVEGEVNTFKLIDVYKTSVIELGSRWSK